MGHGRGAVWGEVADLGSGVSGIAMTFDTVPAPATTTVFMERPFGDAIPVILAWQRWASHADNRLWSTLKLLRGARHASPTIQLTATWIGPASELDAHRAPRNELAGLLPSINAVQPDRSYLDVSSPTPDARAPLPSSAPQKREVRCREAFSATSHVPYNLLNETGAAQLVDRCILGHRLLGARETFVSLDALGGAVMDLPADATGFGHRDAYATVQYTATFAG